MADIYGAVKDSAVNAIIRALMRGRPSLFNYAAPSWRVATSPNGILVGVQDVYLHCAPIVLAPGLDPNTTPRFTRVGYLPAPGLKTDSTTLQLPWCIQITHLEFDFHPGNVVTLPPELSPPLAAQHFAVLGRAQFGLACPPEEVVNYLLSPPIYGIAHIPRRTSVVKVDNLMCFSLSLAITGHLTVTQVIPSPGAAPIDVVGLALDGVEVVDLAPDGLEAAIECYIRTVIRVVVLPALQVDLAPVVVHAIGLTVTPKLAPGLPNNPAIEQDELRAWVDVDIS